MSFYNFIDRNFLLPIADVAYGSSIHSRLKCFRDHDSLSRVEIEKRQNAKLQKLIRHCYDHVPYYTKLFDRLGLKTEDIRTGTDLAKLPILTKQVIRDNYDDLVCQRVD